MKIKAIQFLFFALVPLGSIGQTISKQTTVTGKVDPILSDEIHLDDTSVPIGPDGAFRFALETTSPKFYGLSYGDDEMDLFISPSDSLHIEIGIADSDQEINFSGGSAALNTFLRSQSELRLETEEYLDKNEEGIYSRKLPLFRQILDSLKQVHMEDLNSLSKKEHDLNEWFLQKVRADIEFFFKRKELTYPLLYHRFTGEKAEVPADYYQRIVDNTFGEPRLLSLDTFLDFSSEYLNIMASGNYRYEDFWGLHINIMGDPRYSAISELDAHRGIKDHFLAEHLRTSINTLSSKHVEKMVGRFGNDCTNDLFKEEILQLYEASIKERERPDDIQVYRTVQGRDLEAHIFYPDGFKKDDKRSAYLFFHGGGWRFGKPEWAHGDSKKYAKKGMVAISFEYSLNYVSNAYISDGVRDAQAAVRWARANASELGIDPLKIVAAGYSAGGHLAACTAILKDIGNGDENFGSISSRPNALILTSASYMPTGSGFPNSPEDDPKDFSPFHNLKSPMVPSLLFHGTNDWVVPHERFEAFVGKMKELDNEFEYRSFEGVGHFLDSESAEIIDTMSEKFLVSHGFIQKRNRP
ncbi:alpha/beta hydrolase [Ulvibacterium marinum]|nr:alpha/beta hydrolase [Ulvibacterium marinum]